MIEYNKIPNELKSMFKLREDGSNYSITQHQSSKKKPEIQLAKDNLAKLISWYDHDPDKDQKRLFRKKVFIYLEELEPEEFLCRHPDCFNKCNIDRDIRFKNEYCSGACAASDDRIKDKQANTNIKKYGVKAVGQVKEIRDRQEKTYLKFRGPKRLEKLSNFIEKSNIKFGDKFDYSKSIFIHTTKNMTIICPKHGEFIQTPQNHLLPSTLYGCPECSRIAKLMTQEEFLEKVKLVHTRYDYSKSIVIKADEDIIIECPDHGEFIQTPSSHLNGFGCPKCLSIKKQLPKKSQKEYKQLINKVHKNKFTYSKEDFEYNNFLKTNSILNITCPNHGDFPQKLNNHLHMKQGCPKCSMSKGELKVLNYLEENNLEYSTQKIFKTLPRKRFDFFLEKFNTIIEFDGVQHFEEVDFAGKGNDWAKEQFKRTKTNDKIKNQYCKQYNIKLIRIPYWDIDRIEEILETNLGRN